MLQEGEPLDSRKYSKSEEIIGEVMMLKSMSCIVKKEKRSKQMKYSCI